MKKDPTNVRATDAGGTSDGQVPNAGDRDWSMASARELMEDAGLHPEDESLKTFRVICLSIGMLALAMYPGVIAANLMDSAAGVKLSGLYEVAHKYLIIGSTLYPLIYLPLLSASRKARRVFDLKRALHLSLVPLYFLATLGVALGLIWHYESSVGR